MSHMTRREAIGTFLTGSVVAALMDFTKRGDVMAEETQQTGTAAPQLAPAYRGANQIKLCFPRHLAGCTHRPLQQHLLLFPRARGLAAEEHRHQRQHNQVELQRPDFFRAIHQPRTLHVRRRCRLTLSRSTQREVCSNEAHRNFGRC